MVAGGWAVVLTIIFAGSGLYCLARWARSLADRRDRGTRPERIVDLNHLIMSVAMLAMVWWPFGMVGTVVQIVIFAVFGVTFLGWLIAGGDIAAQVGVGAHLATNVAMIWMLAAMPLLMGGSMSASSGHHHGGGSDMEMPATTMATVPPWVQPTT